ncbi:MAG: hypothetical protein JW990_10770, partial [Thermoleophilia bacterium]|nr:hypothetical protein [Thermoleophilia bacterium]
VPLGGAKRIWTRPELIVLVRGSAEEAVLTTCKYQGGTILGPNNQQCKGGPGGDCSLQVQS